MICKNLLLTVFLMPFALFADGTETQLKELKLKKEMELSDLGNKIAEKFEYTESIRQKAISYLNYEIDKKGLSEHEIKEFGKKIDADLIVFRTTLTNVKTVNGFLGKELFCIEKNEPIEQTFESVRFSLIRVINEYRILKTFVEQYEILEQEHREIEQKLIESQK